MIEKLLNSCKDNSCEDTSITFALGGPSQHHSISFANCSFSAVAIISTVSSSQFLTVPFILRSNALSRVACLKNTPCTIPDTLIFRVCMAENWWQLVAGHCLMETDFLFPVFEPGRVCQRRSFTHCQHTARVMQPYELLILH